MTNDMMGSANHVQLLSFAGFLPETKVATTSFASPKVLPRSLDFVRLTGILAHHEVSAGQGSFELAIGAAKKALSRADIAAKDIDLVINCSVSKMDAKLRQHLSPSFATLIADGLKIPGAQTFDVSNACAGMLTGLLIAESRIKSGQSKYALIVAGEHISPIIDEAMRRNLYLHPRAIASLTVGDGAAAYILGRSEEAGRIIFSEPITMAQFNHYCIGQACKSHIGPQMRTRAKDMQTAVFDNLGNFLKRSTDYMAVKWDEIDHTFSHPTTPKAVKKGAKIATEMMGEINFLHNNSVETANTASTTHGVQIELSLSSGHLKSDETALLISYGSGIGILAMHLKLPKGVEKWS